MGGGSIDRRVGAAMQRLELVERRAKRPSVLRPWRSECLVLRAGDRRIAGRTVAERTGQAWDRGGRGELVMRDGNTGRVLGGAEAERIGLWRALEELRRASWQQGRQHEGELTRVALVTVDASLVGRVCRWPTLPEGCTKAEAARLLGVTPQTINLWLARGKLTARRTLKEFANGRQQVEVAYRRRPKLPGVHSGRDILWPDRAEAVFCDGPDVDWAVERFADLGRRERVVRVGRLRRRRGNSVRFMPLWICPTCGRDADQLLLPAGPMARAGRLWSRWQFQCIDCTGAGYETTAWQTQGSDALGRWIQKETLGRMNGTEFREGLSAWLAGEG